MMRKVNLRVFLAVALLCAFLPAAVPAEDYLDYYEQGEFALRVQKWGRAVELFSKSLEDNPKFFVAYHNRAIAYSKMGEYDKSIQDLKEALRLNPDYPDAYGLMGLVYEIKKNFPEALKVYQEALSREKRPAVQKVLQKYIQDVEAKIKKK